MGYITALLKRSDLIVFRPTVVRYLNYGIEYLDGIPHLFIYVMDLKCIIHNSP